MACPSHRLRPQTLWTGSVHYRAQSSKPEASMRSTERRGRALAHRSRLDFRHGILLMIDHRPNAALALFQRACRKSPAANCLIASAHAEFELGQTDSALQHARAAADLHLTALDLIRGRNLIRRIRARQYQMPEGVRSAYDTAQAAIRSKRFAHGIRLLDELATNHPHLARVHTDIATAHMQLGNDSEAVASFKHAAGTSPSRSIKLSLFRANLSGSRPNRSSSPLLRARAAPKPIFNTCSDRARPKSNFVKTLWVRRKNVRSPRAVGTGLGPRPARIWARTPLGQQPRCLSKTI